MCFLVESVFNMRGFVVILFVILNFTIVDQLHTGHMKFFLVPIIAIETKVFVTHNWIQYKFEYNLLLYKISFIRLILLLNTYSQDVVIKCTKAGLNVFEEKKKTI